MGEGRVLTLYRLSTNVRQGLSWSQIASWDLTETSHPISKEHTAGRRGPRHSTPTSRGFFLRDLEGHRLPLEKGCGFHCRAFKQHLRLERSGSTVGGPHSKIPCILAGCSAPEPKSQCVVTVL